MRPILIFCALLLAGCATTSNIHLQQGRADAAAWDTLNGVANTLDGLARSGLLKGPAAAQAKTAMDAAQRALTAADQAYRRGADASAAQNVATASLLVAQMVDIANAAKGR